MREPSSPQDPSALPSWRGLLFGLLALVGVILLTASMLSRRASPPMQAPSLPPPPSPVAPPAAWQPVAAVLNDAQATSALMLAFDGRWIDADLHARGMLEIVAGGDARAARAANEIGLAHFRAGEFASAVTAFDSAYRADPSDVEVANNLGYAYLKSGRAREAIARLLRSLHLAPLRSSAWINLSEALAELGYADPSLASLLLALRYSTHRDDTRAFLADAARNHASEAFRAQAARALQRIQP
jgi:tetratricopeptide (TPR) repeat protein